MTGTRGKLALALILSLASCKGQSGPVAPDQGGDGGAIPGPAGPATVGSITIDPAVMFLGPGASDQLKATVRDGAGNLITDRTVAWSTSDPSIATVTTNPTGASVRGEGVGQATVTASSGGRQASIVVTVQSVSIVGPKIAFNTDRDGNSEIYLMDPDGTHLVNLSRNPAGDFQPAWSPDGSRIAFVSDRSGIEEIHVMNADGSNVVQLTSSPALWNEFPSWSGTRIAFERGMPFDLPGTVEIFVMNEDGTGEINVTNNPDFARAPSLSPDGSKIVFQSDRDYETSNFSVWESEIYVMNADGSEPVNLSNRKLAVDGGPLWSPDGLRISFTSDRGGQADVFVMNADGSNPVNVSAAIGSSRPIIAASGYCGCPFSRASWAPDGTTLVFGAYPTSDARGEIYVVGTDGQGLRPLTDHQASDWWPAWKP